MVIGDNFTGFFNIFLTYTTQRQIDNWKAPINFDEKRRFKKMSQHLLYFYIYGQHLRYFFAKPLVVFILHASSRKKHIKLELVVVRSLKAS